MYYYYFLDGLWTFLSLFCIGNIDYPLFILLLKNDYLLQIQQKSHLQYILICGYVGKKDKGVNEGEKYFCQMIRFRFQNWSVFIAGWRLDHISMRHQAAVSVKEIEGFCLDQEGAEVTPLNIEFLFYFFVTVTHYFYPFFILLLFVILCSIIAELNNKPYTTT